MFSLIDGKKHRPLKELMAVAEIKVEQELGIEQKGGRVWGSL